VKWRKLGLVWGPKGDLPWARTHAYVPTAYVADRERIRVYVTCWDEQKVGRPGWVDVAADDPTRVLDFSREPILDVGDRGCFDDGGVTVTCAVDWQGRLHLYYVGWQLAVRVPYMLFGGLAYGDQGRFVRHAPVPVLDRIAEQPYCRTGACVLAEDRLRMWYWSARDWRVDPDGRVRYSAEISYAESDDGAHWRLVQSDCLKPEPDDYAIGRPWVVHDSDCYRMWYSIRSTSNEIPYRIGYAESEDGRQWTHQDARVGITVSPSGWDSQMICFASVVDAGERYMFYNGNDHGAEGFGVAVWVP